MDNLEYLSTEEAWERINAKNAEIKVLVEALTAMVGVSDPANLKEMRRVMEAMPCEDSRIGIMAIDALLGHLE